MKNTTMVTLCTSMMLFIFGCAPAAKHALTLADIEPKLAAIGGASFGLTNESEDGFVTYIQIGEPKFDNFFKSAAKIDGIVRLSKGMTTTAIGQLKKFAMSKAADAAMKANIQELVGGTPESEWTMAQHIAVMKMAKAQGKINADEAKYFVTTAGSMAITVVALGKGVKEAKDLLPKGADLIKDASSMLKDPLKATKAKGALDGVKGSVENLKDTVKNTPALLEELNVLLKAFQSLS